jgi:hypothetical protein
MHEIDNNAASDEIKLRMKVEQEAVSSISLCTVPIFGKQNDLPVLNGSGVLLQIADKHFLVTAAHVLDFATIHKIPYYIGAWQQGALPIYLGGMGVLTSGYPPNRALDDPEMRDDDPFDVGVAILPAEILDQLSGRRFLNLTEVDAARRTLDAAYLFFGFPLAFSEPIHHERVISIQALPYFTRLLREEPEERHRNADILLAFRPDSVDLHDNPVVLPSPKGISGCGIWRLNDPTKPWDLWSARDVKLVGIEHRQCSSRKYLVGSWIAYALDLILDEFPELRQVLRIHYSHRRIIV